MTDYFVEFDDTGVTLRVAVEAVLHEGRSDYQDLLVFESPMFGRTLALDGIIQTTERDEAIYHEMLVHVPMLAHGAARRVLIIGGGDGGALREVLKHPVEQVTMVELDQAVVETSKQFLPSLHAGGFEDPRLTLLFADGVKFAAESAERFDVILVDSTDPLPGPGEVLFSEAFYGDCRRLLNPGGILITQFGVPFLYPEAVRGAFTRLAAGFADATLYIVTLPSFAGGYMAFGWASDDTGARQHTTETLTARYASAGLDTRAYTPAFHQAAFVLPRNIAALMA